MTTKMKATIHLKNPATPAMAGRYVGSIQLPDYFVMPGEDDLTQFEGCGLIVSVSEVSDVEEDESP